MIHDIFRNPPEPDLGDDAGSGDDRRVAETPALARGVDILDVLEEAVERNASDVLVTAGAPLLWRIDGAIYPATAEPLSAGDCQRAVYSLLLQEQIARLERERELDFSVRTPAGHRFRGSAYWQRGAAAAALRLVPAEVPGLADLGLPNQVVPLTALDRGLILVTGPTGHGKSTTLAALVAEINRTRRAHIITVEDPIEFEHGHGKGVVDQREVGTDTHGFAEALRHVLRQSPDVIMVGELRDLETISAALTAAETGHLVLATLHTIDAPQTVDRIVDAFPAAQQNQVRGQLSQVLAGVISQRLVPRAGGAGRVLACELMVATSAVRHMIRDDKAHNLPTAIDTGAQQGMVPLDTSLRDLVREGKVTREDAQAVARDPGRIR